MITDDRTTAVPTRTTRELTLDIGGMTCASCVRRVEKALAKVDGVEQASVNLATERATVVADPATAVDGLVTAVTKAGYTATPREDSTRAPAPHPTVANDVSEPVPAGGECADGACELTFDIGGMTCASCVRRVEKALGKVDGVEEASVNLRPSGRPWSPTRRRPMWRPWRPRWPARGTRRRCRLACQLARGTTRLCRAGLVPADATPHPTAGEPADERDVQRDRELAGLKRKWQVSLTAGLSMMALMYVPLPIDAMDLVMPALLVVATVIQFWAGRMFYSAAWAAARHGSVNTAHWWRWAPASRTATARSSRCGRA